MVVYMFKEGKGGAFGGSGKVESSVLGNCSLIKK